MTAPQTDLPWDVFVDRELTRSQTWYARIFDFVNRLRAAADPMGTTWKARALSAVNVPSGVWTRIPMDTILVDSDSRGLSTGTNAGGYSVPATGTYLFSGAVGFTATGAQNEGCGVGRNGSALGIDGASRLSRRVSNSADGLASPWTLAALTAGDVLNLYAYHDVGVTQPTQLTGGIRPGLTVIRLR